MYANFAVKRACYINQQLMCLATFFSLHFFMFLIFFICLDNEGDANGNVNGNDNTGDENGVDNGNSNKGNGNGNGNGSNNKGNKNGGDNGNK